MPPPVEKSAALSVADYSLNEIWLALYTENLTNNKQVNLFRDAEPLNSFALIGNDTTLMVDSLLPQKQYSFSVVVYDGDNDTVNSNTITVSTMDTTSHNFSWEIFTFGEGFNSSILRDVAIIDENNIWAVGEIRIGEEKYNAVHWDGLSWNLRQIYYKGPCSGVDYPELKSIASVGAKLLITNGGDIGYFDGTTVTHDCEVNSLLNGIITEIWGTGLNDLYVVGDFGTIAHYNGTNWRAMESGTDMFLADVYGSNDGEVYISGSDIPTVSGLILRETEGSWSTIIEGGIIDETQLFDKLYGSFAAIWVDERNTVYTGGNLLFQLKNESWDYVRTFPGNYLGGNPGAFYHGYFSGIRGNGSNDWVVCGDRNTLQHFNGSTWQQLGLPYDPSSRIRWLSVEQKENLVVAVGDEGNRAKIILLRR